jgi:hypothetical protein
MQWVSHSMCGLDKEIGSTEAGGPVGEKEALPFALKE